MTTQETPMTYRSLGWTVEVPTGTYYLGDPCYAFDDHAEWMTLLNSCGMFEDKPVGEIRGQQVLAFGTKWGDGSYRDSDGNAYSVDAGLIGLVPWDVASAQAQYPDLAELGRVVTFDRPVTCTDDGSGVLVFGDIKIDTDPEPEDDWEGEDWR